MIAVTGKEKGPEAGAERREESPGQPSLAGVFHEGLIY